MVLPRDSEVDGLLHTTVPLDGLPSCHPWSALLEIGPHRLTVRVRNGALELAGVDDINSSWDFSFTVSPQEWARFCARPTPRGMTSAQALVATHGAERVRGGREVWARAAPVMDRVVEALRAQSEPASEPAQPPLQRRGDPPPPQPGLSPIEGRYLHVEIDGAMQRI